MTEMISPEEMRQFLGGKADRDSVQRITLALKDPESFPSKVLEELRNSGEKVFQVKWDRLYIDTSGNESSEVDRSPATESIKGHIDDDSVKTFSRLEDIGGANQSTHSERHSMPEENASPPAVGRSSNIHIHKPNDNRSLSLRFAIFGWRGIIGAAAAALLAGILLGRFARFDSNGLANLSKPDLLLAQIEIFGIRTRSGHSTPVVFPGDADGVHVVDQDYTHLRHHNVASSAVVKT